METTTDAVLRLESGFRAIAAGSMAGMPLSNPALDVEAVGFARIEDALVGVLITPWAMNLVRIPANAPLAEGVKGSRDLPGGSLMFVGMSVDGFGACEVCSLFSPMFQFHEQETARAVADSVLKQILYPGAADNDAAREQSSSQDRGGSDGRPEVSRRGFLRGAFLSDGSDPS